MLETIILAVIASIGSSGVLTWWFKKRIEHRYEKDLENHKADLKRDYDVQIEKLKAQLQIANVRFSHIFVKQAEAIASTYEKILPLLEATRIYNQILPSPDKNAVKEKSDILNNLRNGFSNYFELIKIYIPPETTKLVDKFIATLRQLTSIKDILVELHELPGKTEDRDKKMRWHSDKCDDMQDEVRVLMDTLMENFQSILGVHIEENKHSSYFTSSSRRIRPR